MQEHDRDPFPVLAEIETSRMRFTASFMRDLVQDVEANTLHLGSEGVKDLYEAARALHLRIEQLISEATEAEEPLDAPHESHSAD
jgi:hypothetical protein